MPWTTLSRGEPPSLYASCIRESRKTLQSMLGPNSITGMNETIGTPLQVAKGDAPPDASAKAAATAGAAVVAAVLIVMVAIAEWLEAGDRLGPEEEARRALIRMTPALAAHERANRAILEQHLAEAVADDLGVAADSLRPRLVSAAAVAALAALDTQEASAVDDPLALVDEALTFLQGGLDALRGRPAVGS